jgi:hypothetical protein
MILLPPLGVASKGIHTSHMSKCHEGWYDVDLSRRPICGYILQSMWILPWRPARGQGWLTTELKQIQELSPSGTLREQAAQSGVC